MILPPKEAQWDLHCRKGNLITSKGLLVCWKHITLFDPQGPWASFEGWTQGFCTHFLYLLPCECCFMHAYFSFSCCRKEQLAKSEGENKDFQRKTRRSCGRCKLSSLCTINLPLIFILKSSLQDMEWKDPHFSYNSIFQKHNHAEVSGEDISATGWFGFAFSGIISQEPCAAAAPHHGASGDHVNHHSPALTVPTRRDSEASLLRPPQPSQAFHPLPPALPFPSLKSLFWLL